MEKAARSKKREVRQLVEVWTPRSWGYLFFLLALAAAALAVSMPATMLVLAVGLAPILASMPLVEAEKRLRSAAYAADAAAAKRGKEFKIARVMMQGASERDQVKKFHIQDSAAVEQSKIGINQTRVFLTPRIISQRPFYPAPSRAGSELASL